MIKLFIFDLGGVVVPASENQLFSMISSQLGVEKSKVAVIYDQLIRQAFTNSLTVKELYKELIKEFEIFDKNIAQQLFESHMLIVRGNINRPNELLLNMIDQLKDDFNVVCLTNTEPEVEIASREDGLYSYFQKAYTSTQLELRKPNPEIFQIVLKDQSVDAAESILIDDRIENVFAANKLGLNSILYDHISSLVKSVYQLIKINNY